MTVVLAEPFKSEVLARQSLGRTRDNDTLYIELVDLSFVQIKRYYYYKLPIFNKYAKSVSDININSYELNERYERIEGKRDRLVKLSPIRAYDERFIPEKQETGGLRPAVYFFNQY